MSGDNPPWQGSNTIVNVTVIEAISVNNNFLGSHMKIQKYFGLFLLLVSSVTWAQPAIWESSFGSALGDLTGEDDEQTSVALSFAFPFNGTTYTTVYVGTNGDIQLGSLGTDADIDYDHWEYMLEFIADGAPSIAGLNTDLDLSTTGTVHFNDFGDRAVFTWNEVGTNEDETALSTFQIQLFQNGNIVLGYNGILDGASEGYLTSLDEGIVVGISDGLWPDNGTEPGLTDLSGNPVLDGSTNLYDRWCYDTANSCGFDGSDDGLPGPVNTAFDLDQRNIVFVPRSAGGFAMAGTLAAATAGAAPPTPATPATPVPTMSAYALVLTMLGLLFVATRRLQVSGKRK